MNNRTIGLTLGATIGLIILATALIPALTDGANAVTATTMHNSSPYSEYGQYYPDDTQIILDGSEATTAADVKILVNNEPVHLRDSFNRHGILVSDNLSVEVNTNSSTVLAYYSFVDVDGVEVFEKGLPAGESFQIDYSASQHIITITHSDEIFTIGATYLFTLSNTPEYLYLNSNAQFADMLVSQATLDNKTAGVIYMSTTAVATASGNVTVTIISDKTGTRVDYNHTSYTGEITAELVFSGIQLYDGTTDIYTHGTPQFIITTDDGEHTLTPSRSWILEEVQGHVVSNSASDLIWTIPVFVLVALVAMVAMAISRRGN